MGLAMSRKMFCKERHWEVRHELSRLGHLVFYALALQQHRRLPVVTTDRRPKPADAMGDQYG